MLLNETDRRLHFRAEAVLPVNLILRDRETRKPSRFEGETIDTMISGLLICTDKPLPNVDSGLIEMTLPPPFGQAKARIKITWKNDERCYYGLSFVDSSDNALVGWQEFMKSPRSPIRDRRDQLGKRRSTPIGDIAHSLDHAKRENIRRITDIWDTGVSSNGKSYPKKEDLLPRQKKIDNEHSASEERCAWLRSKTGATLNHIPVFSEDPENVQGNIENFIGMAQVPIGIAGPLTVNGQFAKGDFYVPMATTEPTLVYTYALGMQLLSLAGGVSTILLKDEMHLSSVFSFNGISSAHKFVQWLEGNFAGIKEKAESTTQYGKLKRLEPHILDRNVVVKFCYTTGDAAGFNMVTLATNVACKFITSIVKPEGFHLQSSFASMKKITAHNLVAGYGKMVIAETTVPKNMLQRFYGITPEVIATYSQWVYLSSAHAGMVGVNGHSANALTALFIACGQDVASVVESHVCITNFEITKSGDLYASVKLPNLIVGTVGGGTGIGTQKECLEMIDCYGHGKAKKFAEVAAATVLAGEVAIYASVASGKFSDAHKKYRKQTQGGSTTVSRNSDKLVLQKVR